MQYRPSFDWQLANRFGGLLTGRLPQLGRAQLQQAVALIRVQAKTAGELAVEYSGLPAGKAADQILVVDRRGWVQSATQMSQQALDRLGLPQRPVGLRRRLASLGYGLVGGLGLGIGSRHLLGQFDGLSPDRRLLLIAPNLLATEAQYDLVAPEFRLWVGLHEQAHAVQLSAAPWLLDYLMERFALIATDDPSLLSGVREFSQRGASALLASAAGQQGLEELTAAMTLLEGHADYVADAAGAIHIPSCARLRQIFARNAAPGRLQRMLPALDKAAQYRRGLAFCNAVVAKVGACGLAAAFSDAKVLPSNAELDEPQKWLDRVHGTA